MYLAALLHEVLQYVVSPEFPLYIPALDRAKLLNPLKFQIFAHIAPTTNESGTVTTHARGVAANYT